ncbi:MAG TPA: ferrochelatase [Terriglobales bacterium]|nr:ferrochelatase [Terriglobales bacterium]
MSQNSKRAVLLLAHGSPESADDVPEFMRHVTGGRALPQPVIEEIKHRYTLAGPSPLTRITLRQGELLAAELRLPVYVGMRNWRPFIADVVRQMNQDGVERAVVIPMAPQNSRTSVGLYRKALDEAGPAFEIDYVENWHDHPLLIKAFAEELAAGWKRACDASGARVPVIFTAHSVPQRTIAEGDPYEQQARETAALVAMQIASLTVDDWSFAFQSQGASGGEWTGPKVEEAILALKAKGHSDVFIQPVGFVCDHIEVLYDIDIAFKQFSAQQGMKLWRAESLNDSPLLIAALTDIARSRLQPQGEAKPQVVRIANT